MRERRRGDSDAPAAGGLQAAASSGAGAHLVGYRWFGVMAVFLAGLLIAPYDILPWMPADQVNISASPTSWLLWFVLAAFAGLSSLPFDQHGLSLMRGVSAMLQGLVVGHLVKFNTETLFCRLLFAVCLGVANACDRLAAMQVTHNTVSTQPVAAVAGALGRMRYRSQDYDVSVRQVRSDGQLRIHYTGDPFYFGNEAVVRPDETNLTLQGLEPQAFSRLLQSHQVPGFHHRPWGIALGVTLSQWFLAGFSTGDSFVAGMLTGQVIILVWQPVGFIILWFLACKSASDAMKVLCVVLCCMILGMDLLMLVPMALTMVGLAASQVVSHSVVIYLAIPVDLLLFLAVTRPTQKDVAEWGLNRLLGNAVFYASNADRAAICTGQRDASISANQPRVTQ